MDDKKQIITMLKDRCLSGSASMGTNSSPALGRV
jgi:hypothetical protein